MKILVTGAQGFIGKNLITQLNNRGYNEIYNCDIETTKEQLEKYASDCEFVFHLAGVNRPKEESQYMEGNYGFTSLLLDSLKKSGNKSPILLTSSIQAICNNPYGISKKAGEELLKKYGLENSSKVYIYRLPNVFGKWCKPNYNSAIATFCYNIAREIPITINDPSTIMNLVYIDDVINEFINTIDGNITEDEKGYGYIPVNYTISLGEIVELLYSFKESRINLLVPDTTEESFTKKIYSTYLSYLPKDKLKYSLEMNIDSRGSFTEFLRTADRGQVSVNISKPGIIKGNHWHHTKHEKFLVVSGNGLIKLRRIDTDEVIDYHVSGEELEVVDIPTGYAHNIINEGDTDLVTIMWCNECYNPIHPDTFIADVLDEGGINIE